MTISNKTIFVLGAIQFFAGFQSAYAGSIASDYRVAKEMKCVRRIVEHNIGGPTGYQFAKNQLMLTIQAYSTQQSLKSINAACDQFIQTEGDKGFDKSGSSLNYIDQSLARSYFRPYLNSFCLPQSETLLDEKVKSKVADHILMDLIYPEVDCKEASGGGNLGFLSWAVGVDMRVGDCVSTNGSQFNRVALGGAANSDSLSFIGGASAGIGGGMNYTTYLKADALATTLDEKSVVGGVVGAVGTSSASYSPVESENGSGTSTVELGVGVGWAYSHGKLGALQIPEPFSSTMLVLLKTFQKDLAVMDPTCERDL